MIPTEHIEFAIFYKFIDIETIVKIATLNKHYYFVAKREIQKILQINENITKSKIKVNLNTLYSTQYFEKKDNIYDNQYWYQLFGNKLDTQQLTIYYAFFICKYNIQSYKKWMCVTYPDGFIKTLPSQYDGSISITHYPEIIISFINYKNKDIQIKYEYNFKTQNKIYININLLKKIISNYQKKYEFKQNIYNLYPIAL